MKRHLIWIIAGTATVGLAVPAFAALQPATPDDNGVPGEIRGNCDEAEHANDPECSAVGGPTIPSTVGVPAVTSPSTTVGTPTTAPDITVPRGVPTTSIDDRSTEGIAPSTSASAGGPVGTVPDATVRTSVPGDISGPCDEAEHANDPRCTGSASVSADSSGHGSDDDNSGHGSDDDNSGHGSDDDNSGHGSDDDNSGHGSDDDSSGHGSDDDNSGHGSDD